MAQEGKRRKGGTQLEKGEQRESRGAAREQFKEETLRLHNRAALEKVVKPQMYERRNTHTRTHTQDTPVPLIS